MSSGEPEPTAEDLEVAYECLRKVPFDVSPVQHLGRIIAAYRRRLQGEGVGRGEGSRWAELSDG